jgi:molybdenum cofactor cytidylyltransferase
MRIFGLLPAGGTSSRMGRPKLALPLGGRSVLERVLDTVRSAHITDVLVVLGPQAADLQAQAEKAGAWTLVLERQTPDMRATIERGLDWLDEAQKPQDGDAILLLPPDHPTLSGEIIERLVAACGEGRGARGKGREGMLSPLTPHSSPLTPTLWIPTYDGRRGHPALVGWEHVPQLRAMPADQGVNAYLRAHANETLEVPCSSADILCDLDTPADYERLQRLFQ